MAKKSEVKGSSKAKKVSKIKTALRMIWENLPQVQATKLFQVLKKDWQGTKKLVKDILKDCNQKSVHNYSVCTVLDAISWDNF